MSHHPIQTLETGRTCALKSGRHLEYLTIAYNSLEGMISVVAGLAAGSIALGFSLRWPP